MSFSIPPTSSVPSYAAPQSPLGSALSSTMDIASTLMQFSTSLLQNLLQAQQSQFGGGLPGSGIPGLGTPGLGTPGLGTPGLGGPQGAGQGLQGILQSVVQLLQALTPLLQALGGGGLGGLGNANPLASSVANQLGGGLGGGLGGLGGGLGGLGGGIPAYQQPFGQQPFAASPYASPYTQSYAQQPFTAFQQPYAGGVASPYNASFAQQPFTSLNQPFTQVDALNWAQTYGGPNLSQSELTQGVNLFNIFNGRTTGMLF